MSRRGKKQQSPYPLGHPEHGIPNIVPNQHDVLCGRGVNVAQHPGNERFRALINSRYDVDYCHSYTTSEKKAVAEDIIKHLKELNPPGRFLKRPGRSKNSRGLEGPWEELTEKEAIKKTCQALRDCNRQDRSGYAVSVQVPDDVQYYEQLRSQSGLTNKQLAEIAAAKAKKEADEAADLSGKRPHPMEQIYSMNPVSNTWGSVSPSVENEADWLKKRKTAHPGSAYTTPLAHPTPTTAATSTSRLLHDDNLISSYHSTSAENDTSYRLSQHYPTVAVHFDTHQQSSPIVESALHYNTNQQTSPITDSSVAVHFDTNRQTSPIAESAFSDPFADDDFASKPSADSMSLNFTSNELDPLHLAAEAALAAESTRFPTFGVEHVSIDASSANIHSFLRSAGLNEEDFPAPSPLRGETTEHQNHGDLSDDFV